MLVVFVVIGAVVVFAIAAALVGRETFRLGHEPAAVVVDVDECVQHVADSLDEDHAARLTYGEVADLVRWYLAHLRAKGLGFAGGEEVCRGDTPSVVVDDDAVAAVLGRADTAGIDVTDEEIVVVLDLTIDYLASVGAVGPPAPE